MSRYHPKKVDLATCFYKNTLAHLVNIMAVNNVIKAGVKIIQQVNNLQNKNVGLNVAYNIQLFQLNVVGSKRKA